MIVRSRKRLKADGLPSSTTLRAIMTERETDMKKLKSLERVYKMHHDIANRKRRDSTAPNTIIQHDYPGYIVKVASSYLIGDAIKYDSSTQAEQVGALRDLYSLCDIDSIDIEIAEDASIYGRGVEIVYTNEEANIRSAVLSPLEAFVVYDNTVEHKPILGIHVLPDIDDKGGVCSYDVYVATDKVTAHYHGKTIDKLTYMEETAHYFGRVPIIEYWNNAHEESDFERVMPLIDAYDIVQSDRVNDKQQFTDSLLMLSGFSDIEGGDDEGTMNRRKRILVSPQSDARMEWITKPAIEADTNILMESLNADIHKFSCIPDMSDQNFAGNTSGVAMRFKMLGLEQITRHKERWFREGLKTRLACYAEYMRIVMTIMIDITAIKMTFTRGMPINDLELAQTLAMYKGIAPTRQLLSRVPFIDDDAEAYKQLMKEEQDRAMIGYAVFGEQEDDVYVE